MINRENDSPIPKIEIFYTYNTDIELSLKVISILKEKYIEILDISDTSFRIEIIDDICCFIQRIINFQESHVVFFDIVKDVVNYYWCGVWEFHHRKTNLSPKEIELEKKQFEETQISCALMNEAMNNYISSFEDFKNSENAIRALNMLDKNIFSKKGLNFFKKEVDNQKLEKTIDKWKESEDFENQKKLFNFLLIDLMHHIYYIGNSNEILNRLNELIYDIDNFTTFNNHNIPTDSVILNSQTPHQKAQNKSVQLPSRFNELITKEYQSPEMKENMELIKSVISENESTPEKIIKRTIESFKNIKVSLLFSQFAEKLYSILSYNDDLKVGEKSWIIYEYLTAAGVEKLPYTIEEAKNIRWSFVKFKDIRRRDLVNKKYIQTKQN